ncbi:MULTISPECIES: PrsW family glutamic-type intramembrane protease [Pirellulaceae]|nr:MULTISPECIES: PrsW family glutamic-type intramembrane protease [Pirellulaceae]
MSDPSTFNESGERWWISIGGQSRGPFAVSELDDLLASKEIDTSTYACPVGATTWQRIGNLGLFVQQDSQWPAPPPPPDSIFAPKPGDDTSRLVNTVESPAGTGSLKDDEPQAVGQTKPSPASDAIQPKGSSTETLRDLFYTSEDRTRIWPLLLAALGPLLLCFLWPMAGAPPTGIWMLSIFGFGVGVALICYYGQLDEASIGLGAGSFLFTFFLALPILFTFQACANADLGEPKEFALHPTRFIPFLIQQIGYGYGAAFAPQQGEDIPVVYHLFAMFISVALCEEALKLVPVLFISKNIACSSKQLVFAGACSGIGFGATEALYYHNAIYTPETSSMTVYLLRFISLPVFHACWTTIAAAMYVQTREHLKMQVQGPMIVYAVALPVLAAIFPSMVLHTLYNVMLTHFQLASLISVVATVVVTYWIFQFDGDIDRLWRSFREHFDASGMDISNPNHSEDVTRE